MFVGIVQCQSGPKYPVHWSSEELWWTRILICHGRGWWVQWHQWQALSWKRRRSFGNKHHFGFSWGVHATTSWVHRSQENHIHCQSHGTGSGERVHAERAESPPEVPRSFSRIWPCGARRCWELSSVLPTAQFCLCMMKSLDKKRCLCGYIPQKPIGPMTLLPPITTLTLSVPYKIRMKRYSMVPDESATDWAL